MADIILHHYSRSPFSEKVRLIFGLKDLAWKSVKIPPIMPKPDLVALTGGFRRTPVMQIGADIYCDTHAMAEKLEQLQPAPSLYEAGGKGRHTAIAMWADRLMFMPSARYVLGAHADDMGEAFHADRAKMRGQKADMDKIRAGAEVAQAQFEPQLSWLDDMLSGGQDYLLGDAPGLADFAAYHCIWFANNASRTAPSLKPYKNLAPWIERIAALGHGARDEITSADALKIAAEAEPADADDAGEPATAGPVPGDRVSVISDDLVPEAVEGTLLVATRDRIVLRRDTEDLGALNIHFPRYGYLMRKL